MNVEGVSAVISPEWIQTTLTLIPVILVCWWLYRIHRQWWHRWLHEAYQKDMRRVARLVNGDLGKTRAGWIIHHGTDSISIEWRIGFVLPYTLIVFRDSKKRIRSRGFARFDWIRNQLPRE